jgi:predicted nuclease with TOPRIM domain
MSIGTIERSVLIYEQNLQNCVNSFAKITSDSLVTLKEGCNNRLKKTKKLYNFYQPRTERIDLSVQDLDENFVKIKDSFNDIKRRLVLFNLIQKTQLTKAVVNIEKFKEFINETMNDFGEQIIEHSINGTKLCEIGNEQW